MASANNEENGGQEKEKDPKRKRESDTGQVEPSLDFDVTWNQSISDVSVYLRFKGKLEKPDKFDVQFEEKMVKVCFPDGGEWSCHLFGEVLKEKSTVKIKGARMELKMIKKNPMSWSTYQDIAVTESTKQEVRNGSSAESVEDAKDELKEKTEKKDKEDGEKIEKEEEPVLYIDHIKHDFFERNENFILHIYVRGVGKDAVKVYFEKDMFLVKFHTQDGKFLQLHPETSEDTVFCWKVKVKKEIRPDASRFKVTQAFIELTLKKLSADRWGSLEAPQRKETDSSKSDTWISTKKPAATSTAPCTTTSSSGLAFDEMSNVNVSKMYSGSYDTLYNDKGERTPTTIAAENIKKPTCKVQPLNKLEGQQVVTPGYTGLDNLGNTCFMNSVLQALANTREFRDFFLDGRFQQEINQDNPLGTGGNLAVSFAVLLKNMWSGKKYSVAPGKLKDIVSKKASQFTGFAQHDAQEFMAFLLDGLHEDLNRIKKKPYTQTVDSDGRADEVVANESWDVYKKRNDSLIVDLFQGQYKSKLVCPVCSKVSITFDPFLYLSVPLPKKCRVLTVTFMWREPYKKPVRYDVRLPKDSRVEQLKEELCKKTGVKAKDMRVFEAYRGKIHKFFQRGSSLSSVQPNDTIIVAEVVSEEVAGEEVYEVPVIQRTLMPNQNPMRCSQCRKPAAAGVKLKRCTKCFKVGYCDQTCQRSHWQLHKSSCNVIPEPVGCPFIVSIPESRATYSRVSKLMEAYARYSVDVFQPPVQTVTTTKLSSHPSTSNLSSSSSQSSGSLNSLDSQSSSASTHTLTADAEQNLEDVDCDNEDSGNASTTALAGSMTSLDSEQAPASMPPTIAMSESFSNEDIADSQSAEASASRNFTIGSSGQVDDVQDQNRLGAKTIPTNPVLGIQSEELERAMPLFHIKPVNQEGFGLKGPEGERLEDKGEVPLDLSGHRFISMDWRNNDKLASYVLVQSKELDAENDESRQSSLSEDSNITLDQCLEVFTEPEVLSPDEAWYCPQCKKHQEATKQMSIWRLPHMLIIQLKRFSFRNFIFRDKIDKMVEFPTRGLNLSQFILGKKETNQQHPLYDLYGVINHHGGILGGHYTSYVRCTETTDPLRNEVDWRLCDDSRVSSVSNEKNVVTRAAYLLFYRQRTSEPLLPLVTSEASTEERISQETKPVTESGVTMTGIAVEKESSDSEDTEKGDNSDNRTAYRDLGYTDMDAVD